MNSIQEGVKIEALQLSDVVFFEPGCFYPGDSINEERLRSIMRDRVIQLGRPLTRSDLQTLAQNLNDGKVHNAGVSGSEYSARLFIRITQRTIN